MISAKRGFGSLLVIVAGLICAAVLSLPVAAVENGGIGAKPARPRADNPRTESIFVYEIEPGNKVEDAVEVINNTDQEKTLLVYATDSQVASGGSFACAQKVDDSLSVGTWIKFSKDSIKLAANSSEEVMFTVEAPKNASAGEQNGCVVVQDANPDQAASGNGIALSFRSAIRVAVTIPGEITKGLNFTGVAAKQLDNGLIRISAGLRNTGNVSLDSDLKLRIKSVFGQTIRNAGGEFPVLANSEASFNFEVDKPFWGGWYTVSATAEYNPDNNKSLGQTGDKQTISSHSLRIFVMPAPQALLIELLALVLLGGVLAYVVWRRKHDHKQRVSAKTYSVKSNDTLQGIAQNHGVSWKSIARVNRLKAPYHIEPKQELKIPAKTNKKA